MSSARPLPSPEHLAASTVAVFSHNLLNHVSTIALLAELVETAGDLSDDERHAMVQKLAERSRATIDLIRAGMMGRALPTISLAVPAPEPVSQPAVTVLDLHRHRVGI